MKTVITVDCCGSVHKSARRKPKLKIVPRLGPFREVSGTVAKTPQFLFARKPKQKETIVAFTLTDSQEVVYTVDFKTKKGNPAKVDGVPEWSTDNTELLALTPAADGLSCKVSAVGPLGKATVTMKADADLGAGVVDIFGTAEVEVGPGTATNVTLTAGAPSEQP